MRIDVFDEAGRLRLNQLPILCSDGDGGGLAEDSPNDANGDGLQAGVCHDCGNDVFSCRCNPGEG